MAVLDLWLHWLDLKDDMLWQGGALRQTGSKISMGFSMVFLERHGTFTQMKLLMDIIMDIGRILGLWPVFGADLEVLEVRTQHLELAFECRCGGKFRGMSFEGVWSSQSLQVQLCNGFQGCRIFGQKIQGLLTSGLSVRDSWVFLIKTSDQDVRNR